MKKISIFLLMMLVASTFAFATEEAMVTGNTEMVAGLMKFNPVAETYYLKATDKNTPELAGNLYNDPSKTVLFFVLDVENAEPVSDATKILSYGYVYMEDRANGTSLHFRVGSYSDQETLFAPYINEMEKIDSAKMLGLDAGLNMTKMAVETITVTKVKTETETVTETVEIPVYMNEEDRAELDKLRTLLAEASEEEESVEDPELQRLRDALAASQKLEDPYLVMMSDRSETGTQFIFQVKTFGNASINTQDDFYGNAGVAVKPEVYHFDTADIGKYGTRTFISLSLPAEYMPVEFFNDNAEFSHLYNAGLDWRLGVDDSLIFVIEVGVDAGTSGADLDMYRNGTNGDFVGAVSVGLEVGFRIKDSVKLIADIGAEAGFEGNMESSTSVGGALIFTPANIPWLESELGFTHSKVEMDGENFLTNEVANFDITIFPGRDVHDMDNPLNKGLFFLTFGTAYNISSFFDESDALNNDVEQYFSGSVDFGFNF